MTVSRAFADLGEGSDLLTQLRRETEEKARQFPMLRALRPNTLWGEKEDIVSPNRFDTDPPAETTANRGHTDVCKVEKGLPRCRIFRLRGEIKCNRQLIN